MNSTVNFTFAPGLDLHVIDHNGEPWFVAKDVCTALGVADVTMTLSKLDNDEEPSLIWVNGAGGR